MRCRLWFWSRERPRPRVVDECSGSTLVQAAANGLAPVHELTWSHEVRDGQLYLVRGLAGYCCEPADGPGPRASMLPARP
ncbi:MAG: hypothetical protein ABIH23_05120, partial [bacterium]